MSEFNLSEKRQDTNKGTEFIRYAYSEEDVKEFIRLLKERIDDEDWFPKKDIECFKRIIDKFSGEKLT